MTTTETVRVEVKAITDAEIQGMVMKKLAEVIQLEDARKEKSKKRQAAQDEETDAKKAYEAAVEELKDLQREMTGGLFHSEPESILPNVFDDADQKAIRAIELVKLELSDKIIARLVESDEDCKKPQCITLGDLEEWFIAGGRLTKIKTITDKKVPSIREAINKACEPFTGKPEEVAA